MNKKYPNELKVWKGMEVKDAIQEFSKAGFCARGLGEAHYVWKKMLEDKECVKILSAAGALVPGGMRNVFTTAIKTKLIDVLVLTTGSILDHDLIEAFGVRHEQGEVNVNDVELAKKNINRIYDVYLPNQGYILLEKKLREIFPKLPQEELSPSQFLYELGKNVEDKDSILRVCAEMKVPIFDAGITDSITGFHTWMYSQDHKLKLNPQLDIRDFLELVWKRKRYGLIILGGGLPKHFVAGMMQVTGNSLNYAIQITMSRPEYGGVSGAPLREAKSWKKVAADALTADVVCDATIAFPLLVASLL
ncbi:MAG: deoxyhypusine synthase family protein [Candidatus Aenigmarchaeota archaeon]|nr:deoxyhypusine synthase family protein [Candidatus Aenigmarchaeota archaeon]